MRKRICFIVSAEITVKAFLTDYIEQMQRRHGISLIVNTKNPGPLKKLTGGINIVPMGIERKINIARDMLTLCKLYLHFRKERYDLVHSFTPKAGLLSMTSARAAGIPVRIHTFTGQVWANRSGISRFILKLLDRILASSATNILVDSFSQRDFIVKENVVPMEKTGVIAHGSICGVDMERFKPDAAARLEVRKIHHIPESDIVFLFLGRLKMDKGILDLARAFSEVRKKHPNVHLMIIGPDEDDMKGRVEEICKGFHDHVHFEGYTDTPQRYMAASDVFCLPSYREGFGLVVIEAASTGIPSIASRIYGITDAIDDTVTGYLFGPGNIEEIANTMEKFITSYTLIGSMGEMARKRARELFEKNMFIRSITDYYEKTLGN